MSSDQCRGADVDLDILTPATENALSDIHDQPHHVLRLWVRLEPVSTAPPCGMRLVRVRPGVGQPVPVRRTATEVPALVPGLNGHRGPYPDAGPYDFPL